jgi:group I intron endonuclease
LTNKELRNNFGIYLIKNKINNKYYIGKTEENFYRRWTFHKWQLKNNIHENKHLQRAFNKYGLDNFEFKILVVCNANDDINKLEKEYIEIYDSYKNGYNQTLGGEGTSGNKLSEKSKKSIGEKNKINMTGKKHSEETKRLIS